MTEDARTERNREMLASCNPIFRHRLALVIAMMQAAGYRPRIQQAWRSPAEQLAAFKSGHSELRYGFHNCTTPEGNPDALAADVLDDEHALAPPPAYLFVLAREARANGLTTGIDWGLPVTMKAALNEALMRGLTWDGKVGWDACHVQPADLTVQQARAGVRPTESPLAAGERRA